MVQIFQDFGGCQILFIRYNPDAYIDDKGQKSPISGRKREKILVETISGILAQIAQNEEFVHILGVIYLGYDGWDGSVKIEPLEYESPKNMIGEKPPKINN